MQYHVEHHMYPAVPFFNLPKLREKLAHDLPPAPHGLRATWKEMIEIKRRLAADKGYQFIPVVPDKQWVLCHAAYAKFLILNLASQTRISSCDKRKLRRLVAQKRYQLKMSPLGWEHMSVHKEQLIFT